MRACVRACLYRCMVLSMSSADRWTTYLCLAVPASLLLASHPIPHPRSPDTHQSFLAALKRFSQERGPQAELTLAETLQLVNLRPTAPVEVHLVRAYMHGVEGLMGWGYGVCVLEEGEQVWRPFLPSVSILRPP